MRSKFIYSRIPNTAQYKLASWAGELEARNCSLEDAKRVAESNSEVSFFFHERATMLLEGGEGGDRTFYPNDNVFFKGDYWLGSAVGYADTYLTAEVYDTSDAATATEILNKIRRIRIGQGVDTSGGTTTTPIQITAGFVFVEFNDITGDNLDTDYSTLVGSNNELVNFINTESGGKVSLNLVKHASWINLEQNHTVYSDNAARLITDLDAKFEFPNDWDIVFIAFPNQFHDRPSQNAFINEDASDGRVFHYSHCSNGVTVDTSQRINRIFMDPSVYKDARPEYVTIHELMHALGLPDLYNAFTNRSYGWSLMSDCRTGWHLTGFEKLALGWESLDDYIVLKRGLLKTDLFLQGAAAAGKKGVIVLPEDNGTNTDTYFMEIGQPVGRSVANKNSFDTYGLLTMIAKPSSGQGCINPFVSDRPDATTKQNYGGASKAPFVNTRKLKTNGIRAYSISTYDQTNKKISCVIGVDASFSISDNATQLRENEKIELAGNNGTFSLDITGFLFLDGSIPVNNNSTAMGLHNVKNQGYGYCAYVDNQGTFHLAASANSTPLATDIIKSFGPPAGTTLSTGKYFFKVENTSGRKSVAIYQEASTGGAPVKKYELFTEYVTVGGSNYRMDMYGNVYSVDGQGRSQWIGSGAREITAENNHLKKVNSQDSNIWYYVGGERGWSQTIPA